MIRKEHIEKMKLLGAMLGATANGVPAIAVNAGLEYAQRLATDKKLQADVTATFSPSLAERDLKRAAQVVKKYGTPIAPEPAEPTDEDIEGCFGHCTAEDLPAALAMFDTCEPVKKPEAQPGKPLVKSDPLLIDVPFEQTEDGFYAEQRYWNEHEQGPPEGFDLRMWSDTHPL